MITSIEVITKLKTAPRYGEGAVYLEGPDASKEIEEALRNCGFEVERKNCPVLIRDRIIVKMRQGEPDEIK